MKKNLIGLGCIILIVLVCIYVFIPSKLIVNNKQNIKCFQATASHFLKDNIKIKKCFLNVATEKNNAIYLNGLAYTLNEFYFNGSEINIKTNNVNTQSHIIPLLYTSDSSTLIWMAEFNTSNNPFKRVSQYFNAIKIKENMQIFMAELNKYLEKPENMYGINIKEINLKDSVLISIKTSTNFEPTTDKIYQTINLLENYALSQNATATNSPMVNIQKNESLNYDLRIGLPISKLIKETNEIKIKRMPYNGKMFTTEVMGGNYKVSLALARLKEYVTDANRTSPAIPYQLFITNRKITTDSTKWITKINYPIM